jgi:hypothetical protein
VHFQGDTGSSTIKRLLQPSEMYAIISDCGPHNDLSSIPSDMKSNRRYIIDNKPNMVRRAQGRGERYDGTSTRTGPLQAKKFFFLN